MIIPTAPEDRPGKHIIAVASWATICGWISALGLVAILVFGRWIPETIGRNWFVLSSVSLVGCGLIALIASLLVRCENCGRQPMPLLQARHQGQPPRTMRAIVGSVLEGARFHRVICPHCDHAS